ncbi:hypothetical protein F5Y04DRAFT_170834 [Hypomontagnella monticulosa]|nr:hypothetical protein F5Y04DRAFT_170834 [Hypomontagnella monticulosa]
MHSLPFLLSPFKYCTTNRNGRGPTFLLFISRAGNYLILEIPNHDGHAFYLLVISAFLTTKILEVMGGKGTGKAMGGNALKLLLIPRILKSIHLRMRSRRRTRLLSSPIVFYYHMTTMIVLYRRKGGYKSVRKEGATNFLR